MITDAGWSHALRVITSTVASLRKSSLEDKETRQNYVGLANMFRDWLKHRQSRNDPIECDAEEEARDMIDRAYCNYFKWTSDETPLMKRFLDHSIDRSNAHVRRDEHSTQS